MKQSPLEKQIKIGQRMLTNYKDEKLNGLIKTKNPLFDEYYEGTRSGKKVICILDNNCVRYMVFENGKRKSRCEFSNMKKELCFKNATRALNK